MATSDLEMDRLIYGIYADQVTKAYTEVDKVEARQAICGTIGHEVDEAHDKMDWWIEMGRWNPFKAERVGNRIEVSEVTE